MRKLTKKETLFVSSISLFVIIVLIATFWRLNENRQTKKLVDDLAKRVAANPAVLMIWASGKEKDIWGNTFVLECNNESIQFCSKGADGKCDTKDDIHSELFKKKKINYAQSALKWEVKPPTTWQKLKSKFW